MTTPMTLLNRMMLATAAAFVIAAAFPAQAVANACGLLTKEEVAKLITRGQQSFSSTPDALAIGGGSICQYEYGQTGLWTGPGSGERFEQYLVSWKQDKEPREPVSGVGDKAYIIYPKAKNKYSDEGPFLVATVGPHVVTAALFAKKGNANGLMAEVCRANPGGLSEKEKKECESILADTGETPESLQPAVVELAKALVAKVRAGNLGQ